MRKFLGVLAIASLVMVSSLGDAVEESLMLYLPFNEGKGDEVKDLSGNENHGAFTGNPKWVDGKFSKALEFELNSWVEVPASDSFEFKEKESFTLEAWVKPDAPATDEKIIIGRILYNGEWKNPWDVIYWLRHTSGGFCMEIRANGVSSNANCYGPPIPAGDWHHVAGVRDAQKEARLYIDGKLVKTCADPTKGDFAFEKKPLCIGAYPPLAGWHANFIGAIDDVAIYKKALTEEEIQRDMEGIKAAAVFPSGKLATSWGFIKTQL